MRDGELVFGVMCGSLRKGSYNRLLGEAMARLAPDGVRLQNLPSIGDVPHFDEDLHGERVPDSVEALAQAVRDADAVIISVPEYNYSFPGVLKNAVDWLSWTKPQPFANKPVFIMSASPHPYGGSRGQLHFRQVLVAVNAVVLPRPEVIVANADEKFDEEGRLTDERTREFLGKALNGLQDYVRRFA